MPVLEKQERRSETNELSAARKCACRGDLNGFREQIRLIEVDALHRGVRSSPWNDPSVLKLETLARRNQLQKGFISAPAAVARGDVDQVDSWILKIRNCAGRPNLVLTAPQQMLLRRWYNQVRINAVRDLDSLAALANRGDVYAFDQQVAMREHWAREANYSVPSTIIADCEGLRVCALHVNLQRRIAVAGVYARDANRVAFENQLRAADTFRKAEIGCPFSATQWETIRRLYLTLEIAEAWKKRSESYRAPSVDSPPPTL